MHECAIESCRRRPCFASCAGARSGLCLSDSLRALPRASCWQWFQVLGPVRDGAAQAFHLRMFMVASSDRCEVAGASLGPAHLCTSALLLQRNLAVSPSFFESEQVALVNARGMACRRLGRSVNEVLLSFWCMSAGACCCPCHAGECARAFTSVCFKDSVF